jgi:hypothetical protein
VFTRALHWCLSWATSIQSIPSQPVSLRSIWILSTRLRLGLPSGLIPSGAPVTHRKFLPDYTASNSRRHLEYNYCISFAASKQILNFCKFPYAWKHAASSASPSRVLHLELLSCIPTTEFWERTYVYFPLQYNFSLCGRRVLKTNCSKNTELNLKLILPTCWFDLWCTTLF